MYTRLNKVLKTADRFNYTVGAFNMHNLEMLPYMIIAAKEKSAPIIIQTSVGTAKYIGYGVIVSVCQYLASEEGLDIVLHLDHATNFDDIKEAIKAGYSSVMYDGSALPFKENILTTKQVVDFAKNYDVSVEGEIGVIGGREDGVIDENTMLTKPEDAEIFANETQVDALAISVGTTHGQFTSKANVNFELLRSIYDKVKTPLVIHGGTGVSDKDIKKCIDNGIRKFNVGTELLVGWTKEAQSTFSKTKVNSSLRNNILPCNRVIKDIVKNKITLFLNQ